MYQYNAIITKVVDGDTVHACVDLGFNISYSIKVRLADIDTPETYRPKSEAERQHGYEAKTRLTELVDGVEVTITSKKDPGIYGRYTAEIFLPDGMSVADILKAEGFEKLDSYPAE